MNDICPFSLRLDMGLKMIKELLKGVRRNDRKLIINISGIGSDRIQPEHFLVRYGTPGLPRKLPRKLYLV